MFEDLQNIPLPDKRHLEAAEGWIGLGNYKEAAKELEQINPEFKNHPFVLVARYKLLGAAKHWDKAVKIAMSVQKLLPANPWGHFHAAFALHELKRTQEAYDTLTPIAGEFPDNWLMRFNLACYSCQLGKLDEAMHWLEKAIRLTGRQQIRQLALDDQDLEPLWPKIKEL